MRAYHLGQSRQEVRAMRLDQLGRYALPRAVFLGILGALTLVFPAMLTSRAFYAMLTAYVLLGAGLRILDFILGKRAKTPVCYADLAAGCLGLIAGLHGILFARYLAQVTPVLLGGLLLLQGLGYFLVACRVDTAKRKGSLIPLSLATLLGGLAVLVFTFGFGVGGLAGLGRVSGVALLLSCAAAAALGLMRRRPLQLHPQGGL